MEPIVKLWQHLCAIGSVHKSSTVSRREINKAVKSYKLNVQSGTLKGRCWDFFQCCKIDLIPRFGIFNSTISNGEWETRLLTFLLLLGLIYRFQDRLNNVLIVVSDAWNRYRPRQQAEMIGETRISSKKSGRCRARFVSSHRSKKNESKSYFFRMKEWNTK